MPEAASSPLREVPSPPHLQERVADQCSPPTARTAGPTRDAGTFPEGPRRCPSIPTQASLALLGPDGVCCVRVLGAGCARHTLPGFPGPDAPVLEPWGTPAGTRLFWELVFTISGIFRRTCRVTTLTVSILRRGKRGLSHTAILGTAKSSQKERKGEECSLRQVGAVTRVLTRQDGGWEGHGLS